MPITSSVVQPYFSHDINARTSKKIILLLEDFGYEGYGLFWAIVEFMHRNELKVGEERFVCGRLLEEKVKSILNDYELFRIEDNCYVSDRIIRNIEEQEEKSNKGKNAAETRWILSAYKKIYKEVFNLEPVLEEEEIQTLKKYSKKIKNFKDVMEDIVFTLSKIEFSNGITQKARSNWLLKDDNLGKVYNGQFGNLKSWKAEKEKRQPKKEEKIEEFVIPEFSSKAEAIDYIKANNSSMEFIIPAHKKLMKKFDITLEELKSA